MLNRSLPLFTDIGQREFSLPLSFFTSYFGMNVREFTGQPGNTSQLVFWRVSGPISAAIVLLALLVAFNRRVRGTLRTGFRLLRSGPSRSSRMMEMKEPPV